MAVEYVSSARPKCSESAIWCVICGSYFAQNSVDIVYNMQQMCIQCNQYRNLMTGFTPVRCSDHIICVECLEVVMKGPEPRCPNYDNRRFTQYEIEAAKQMFSRQCALYCGRFFPSSEALPLDWAAITARNVLCMM